MERIRIMMADDSPEIRSYFSNIISHEADMDLVGTAASGAEAVQMAHELRPDIILMDIQMETRIAGISASKQILREHPAMKIIILTILEDDDLLFQAYCAGVIDYIIKTDSISQILTSVRNGCFTVPGDGDVDFDPVFKVLADAGYKGWLLVEAEQDPAKANPLEYAIKGRKYIKEHTGL